MISGSVGTILVQRLHLPDFGRVFLAAFEEGGLDGLRATFDEALTLREASSMANATDPLYRAGNTLLSRGHTEAGLAFIEWVAERDPDAGRAHANLGNVYNLYGDKALAIEHLEAALASLPDNEGIKRTLEAARRYRR